MPDFQQARVDLYWSANHEKNGWERHGEAVRKRVEDEPDAFDLLLKNQSHNEPVQENYKRCRLSSFERFWSIAVEVFDPNGPHLDC